MTRRGRRVNVNRGASASGRPQIDPPTHLAEVLTPGRIVLGLHAGSLEEAIRKSFASVPAAELPRPADKLARAVVDREKIMPTYLGRGLEVPHARLGGLERPLLLLV